MHTISQAPIAALRVDPSTQRPLNLPHARKIAASFDMQLVGLIDVVDTQDGQYSIIDGQHRVAAAKIAKYDGHLPIRIIVAHRVEDQARAFLALNNQRSVTLIEKFKVRVTAMDPVALSVNRMLLDHGLEAGRTASCVDTLETISIKHGATHVSSVLTVLVSAWGFDSRAVQRLTVRAVSKVLLASPGIDYARLVKQLLNTTPAALRAKADAGRELLGLSVDVAAVNAIIGLYNKGLRGGRLEEIAK